jgi:putative tricarboxylic transport membrane protein
MPFVLVLCILGAYGDNTNLFDVWVMLGAGVVGYLMRKSDYEPAPLVVGLVLGPVMERSLRQTLIISQGDISGLWESPISAILLLSALVAAVTPIVLPYLKTRISLR